MAEFPTGLSGRRFRDLTNHPPFERLTIIEFHGMIPCGKQNTAAWLCQCECGNKVVVRARGLIDGSTRSCGCLQTDAVIATGHRNRTHGGTGSIEHKVWLAMHGRCYNKNNHKYKDYGGRGIIVVPEWHDFTVFLSGIGPRPSSKHSIDRIDVNGPYSKENCRWATASEQARNRRNSILLTHDGETHSLPDWADIKGVDYHVFAGRYKLGWTTEKILTTPHRYARKRPG